MIKNESLVKHFNVAIVLVCLTLSFTQLYSLQINPFQVDSTELSPLLRNLRSLIALVLAFTLLNLLLKSDKPTSAARWFLTLVSSLASLTIFQEIFLNRNAPKVTFVISYIFIGLVAIVSSQYFNFLDSSVRVLSRVYPVINILALIFIPQLVRISGNYRYISLVEGRFSGIFGNANITGFFSAILVAWLISKKDKAYRKYVFLNLLILVLTESRVSIFAVLLVFIIQFAPTRGGKIVILVSKTAILALVSVFMVIFSVAIVAGGRLNEASNLRNLIWRWAYNQILDNPLFGIGLVQYNERLKASASIFWVHTHNQFLQELLIGGLVRLFVVLFIYISLFRVAKVAFLAGNRLPLSIFMVFIFQSFFEVPFFMPTFDFRFFVSVVICGLIFQRNHAQSKLTLNSDKP